MSFQSAQVEISPAESIQRYLSSFPIACFSLTVLTDIAYWQTTNMLWLHFSEWLLFAGLVFGALAGIVAIIRKIAGRTGITWITILGWIVILGLAILNSLIHTADGWTAVMPWGITTSVVTLIVMIAVGFLGRRRQINA